MRDAMRSLNGERKKDDLLLKIGIHEGPCLAVMLNDRQDYFGQTVNIASRVQGLADEHAIFASASVVENAQTAKVLAAAGLTPQPHRASLRGIGTETDVFAIP
jgi:class 3 adenylate cyclase